MEHAGGEPDGGVGGQQKPGGAEPNLLIL
jgi:hypothetical protein